MHTVVYHALNMCSQASTEVLQCLCAFFQGLTNELRTQMLVSLANMHHRRCHNDDQEEEVGKPQRAKVVLTRGGGAGLSSQP